MYAGRGGSYLTPPFVGLLAFNFDHAGLREPSNSLTRNVGAGFNLYELSLQLINAHLDVLKFPRLEAIRQFLAHHRRTESDCRKC